MPSLREVAQLAGVSITTVSKILNSPHQAGRFSDACIQRVRDAARELGYHRNYHAGILRGGKCMNVGVALSVREVSNVLAGHYWGSLLGGVEVGARSAGYELTLTGPDSREDRSALRRAVEHLRQRRIDGLVVPKQYGEEELDMLTEVDAPIVAIQYQTAGKVPVIRCDDIEASRLLVEHLVALGHRRIAWLGPEKWTTGAGSVRLQAFSQACRESSVQADVWPIKGEDTHWWLGEVLVREAQENMLCKLKKKLEVSAVVCFNDLVAVGVYHALDQMGMTPGEDLAVAGYDNSVAELTRPALTSVEMGFFDIGRRALEVLLTLIDQDKAGRDLPDLFEKVPPRLEARKSTTASRQN